MAEANSPLGSDRGWPRRRSSQGNCSSGPKWRASLATAKGVKLLDFGLAKMEPSATGMPAGELSDAGMILGTLRYMSPEQVQGKDADARSDIFSFGCVIYEVLTGKMAFDGATNASVIAAILEHEPQSLEGIAPPSITWIVRRCLAKDPDERWQSARDLRAALERAGESSTEIRR